MNKKRLLLLPAFPLLLLAGCSHDGIEGGDPSIPTGQNGDIQFEIGFAQPNGTAYTTTENDTPRTRVATDNHFRSTWEDGDEIGVFAVTHGQPLAASGNFIHNVKLTYSSANGDAWTSPAYWPQDGTVLDFYAYYPYDANATDPTAITFKVKIDQSERADHKSNYNLSDLLTAKGDNYGSGYGKGQTVSLQFSHALAMVQVTLDNTTGAIDHNQDVTVMLRDFKTGAALNLGASGDPLVTLMADNNDVEAITMCRVADAAGYVYRALIPAQTIVKSATLFRISNGDLILNSSALTAQLAMTAGVAETFTQEIPVYVHKVEITAGTFIMGSPEDEPDRDTNEPQHEVTLTKDFHMGKYQVTNAQFAAFLNEVGVQAGEPTGDGYREGIYKGDKVIETSSRNILYNDKGLHWNNVEKRWNPAPDCENHPVIYVTWTGASAYAEWVGGSLPTEAQWEYACRAGSITAWATSSGTDSDLEDYAWYEVNKGSFGRAGHGTKAAGLKKPNQWGLYDMHGNVNEWCLDHCTASLADYNTWAVTDPLGIAGTSRVLRGGGWDSYARSCRSAHRHSSFFGFANNYSGFRVVFVP